MATFVLLHGSGGGGWITKKAGALPVDPSEEPSLVEVQAQLWQRVQALGPEAGAAYAAVLLMVARKCWADKTRTISASALLDAVDTASDLAAPMRDQLHAEIAAALAAAATEQ